MSKDWRVEQMEEWERSRLQDVRLDLTAHWVRCIPVVVLAAVAFAAVDYLRLPRPAVMKFSIGLLVGVFLAGKVIIWLRLWGAYIERRLTDMEAFLTNERPVYYTTASNLVSFDDNPLFAKLTAIEASVRRLEQRLDDPSPGPTRRVSLE
jgi:hypothetical protein